MSAGKSGPRYAFIIGTGRCGSSLLQELVSRHPSVTFVSNAEDRLPRLSRIFSPLNSRLYRITPPSLTRKGRLRFAPSEGYRILGREVSPILVEPFRDLTADDLSPWLEKRLTTFFQHRARTSTLLLHKFTGWPRSGFIHAALPDARFVHLVRDGRAIANSLLQMPWWSGFSGPRAWRWGPLNGHDEAAWEASGRSFAVLAGLEWKLLIEAYEAAQNAIPPDQWLEIRYEDLIAEPEHVLTTVLDFLQLPWNRAFGKALTSYEFDNSRPEAYLKDLSSRDMHRLEEVLDPYLRKFGYELRS